MKLVLFDCDGTLIDSAHVIHASMEKTFAEAGLAVPELHHTKSIIGLTLDKAFSVLLQEEINDRIVDMVVRYKHHSLTMREEEEVHEPFYDGIWDLLDELRGRDDILLGVVTGKSRRGLDNLLARHDLEKAIITSRTADECPSKPHPAMVLECCRDVGVDAADTIVVGDAIYDMQMARSAAARAIGVTWGYSTPGELTKAGAHSTISHPSEVLDHLMGATE
ncbi:MAG: hydrolase [Rhizobiaceae bacterium MnEN-MB40S]|nr:MAG: hydrolase [Rhizobiaceae bacterium MnEN-MB40S]